MLVLNSKHLSLSNPTSTGPKYNHISSKSEATDRGKWPNMGRCIISYQEVLSSLVKNVNHQADEALL
jgi:hypothetical protein